MRWYLAKNNLPKSDRLCELICENGKAIGHYVRFPGDPDESIEGWMVDVTKRFIKDIKLDIGQILKWRYLKKKEE